jgi:multicomponent Na+:H+ antiporter subunit D
MNVSALAPLAFAAPLLASAAIGAFGKMWPRRVTDLVAIVAGMLTSLIACALLTAVAVQGTVVHWFGGWTPRHGVALGIAFVVDPVGGALATFAAFLTFAALIYAWTYYDEGGPEFHTLLLAFAAALIGFFLTGDLFNMFVFFELMSVSAYALTSFRTEDETAVLGALSFGIVNSVGAFLVLIGIVMVYARTGALNFEQLGHTLSAHPPDALVVTAFALIAFGFMVKASIVPVHFWLSEAHAVAPTPLCVLFSGIMVQAGLYAVARVYTDVFSGPLAAHEHGMRIALLCFGLVTAAVGATMCMCQRHFKRLLAFSTISHSGIMLCALALFSARGLGGFVAYVVGHGLVKGSLFMSSGIVLNRWKSLDVDALRGRLRGRWWLVTLIALGALGLAGLPLFATFVGKAIIDRAADDAGLAWLPPALLVAAAATSAAVLQALGTMAFGWGPPPSRDSAEIGPKAETPETSAGAPVVMLISATALLVTGVALAFVPGRTTAPLSAALRFLDRPLKLAVTMDAAHSGPLPAVAPQPLGDALPLGLGATVLALALAAWALFGYRVRALWSSGRAFAPLLHALRLAHSGVVTDYVVWLVAGTAAFGCALIAAAGR